MTPERFVDILRKVAVDGAVQATLQALANPPGRRPRAERIALSKWFLALNESDRSLAAAAMHEVAHLAVFNVLTILDGTRLLKDDADRGEYRLTFRKEGVEWELTATEGVLLHDMLTRTEVFAPKAP